MVNLITANSCKCNYYFMFLSFCYSGYIEVCTIKYLVLVNIEQQDFDSERLVQYVSIYKS